MVNNQIITDKYAIYNGDCNEVLQTLPNNSIHLSVYSPPFGGLYHYSSDPRDLSNSDNYTEFLEQYEFTIKELYRITLSGRITAVHCSDIPNSNNGKDSIRDFPGDLIRLHEKNGFNYIARFCIWKEPLAVRNRTMAKCLAHKTIVSDSIYSANAGADYIIVFRKKGINEIPVTHEHGLLEYFGEKEIPLDLLPYKGYKGNQIENRYSHWVWRQYASSIWDDIRIHNILPYEESRDEDDEKHVHPLQLDVIHRLVELYSNHDENVLTPFMGVGSEVYGAVVNGRRGIGIELKESYFKQAIKNIENIGVENNYIEVPLFDNEILDEIE
jgi:DNA modification methylase